MKAGLPLAEPQRHVASLLAVVALVVMQLFRAEQQWHTAFVLADSILMLSLAMGLAAVPACEPRGSGGSAGRARPVRIWRWDLAPCGSWPSVCCQLPCNGVRGSLE